MKVLITSPHGKERLVEEFSKYAEVVHCLQSGVELIVPTVDEELPFFASAKSWFAKQGIQVMVSSPDVIAICRDKAEFYRTCNRHSKAVLPTMQEKHLIAKPRFGKGGKGLIHLDKSYIVQPYSSHPEYSVDYFGDWEGNAVSIVPRTRLDIENGASQRGEIRFHDVIIDACREFGEELRLIGANTIQGFYTGHEFIFSEINNRFGGGSHLTWWNFNSVKWLVDNATASKGSEV